jgi:4'-phosphopantetheinyl transferase EntD
MFQISTPRSMEINMNRNLASTLTIVSTAAAAFALAAMASGNAYADDITVDNTPFVSTRTRAEVQAEVMGRAEQLRMANSEWATQQHQLSEPSSLSRAQVKAEYIASRREANALNSEDSGSSYFAALPRRTNGVNGVIIAGSER